MTILRFRVLALSWLTSLLLTAGCAPEPGAGGQPSAVRVAATLWPGAPAVVHMLLIVSSADAEFEPIEVELLPEGDGWGAFVSGIPAGLSRRFDVVAQDVDQRAIAWGQATGDVLPDGDNSVVITLSGAPSPPWTNTAPAFDALAIATRATPGGTLSFFASGHDPDTGEVLTWSWRSSCGTFDDAASPSCTWTAPAEPATCAVTVTLRDGRGAGVSRTFEVVVAAF